MCSENELNYGLIGSRYNLVRLLPKYTDFPQGDLSIGGTVRGSLISLMSSTIWGSTSFMDSHKRTFLEEKEYFSTV